MFDDRIPARFRPFLNFLLSLRKSILTPLGAPDSTPGHECVIIRVKILFRNKNESFYFHLIFHELENDTKILNMIEGKGKKKFF